MLRRVGRDGVDHLGVRLVGAGLDQLDGEHRADPAHVADDGVLGLQFQQRGLEHALDALGLARGRPPRSCSNTAMAAAQAIGLPPKVPPRPPGRAESMISARPVTPASGSPPAMPFALSTMSGTSPKCVLAKYSPVRAIPLWISSAMNTIPFAVHHSCSAGR